MNDGLAIIDPDGGIIYSNDKYCELLGYSRDEVIGRYVSEFLDEKNKRILRDELAKRRGGLSSRYEITLINKSGLKVIVIVSATPLFDKDGKYNGSFAVVTDITERKRAEDEKENLIAELVKALSEIKLLRGLIPICARCSKIRDVAGNWNNLEEYIEKHSHATFTHAICPDCVKKKTPENNSFR